MNGKQLQLVLDRSIKEVWLTKIPEDYASYYLLKEDTLKNALYFHLRTKLQTLFSDHRLRIYTEYHYKGLIADLALVQLKENDEDSEHLQDAVESVLAVIEIKYKSGGSTTHFENDINKIQRYVESEPFDECQFYLAFLHEVVYEPACGKSWLSEEQKTWSDGRLTELNGYYQDEEDDELTWEVIFHNNFDKLAPPPIHLKIYKEHLESKAGEFNEKKYNHDYYNHYLNVIAKASSVTKELIEAVEHLFYWKLGKVSLKQTATSKAISLPNGQQYYINGTTGSNKLAIANATKVELLELGLGFRDGTVPYEELRVHVDDITQFAGSIVLPTLFIHIFQPDTFPILDVRVWRTYLWAQDNVISKHTKPRSWQHYDSYRQFFKETETSTPLPWRTVDKGLWVIGDEAKVE